MLSSALECFTAVFGMGTGGTTALWPPDVCTADCCYNVSGGHLLTETCTLVMFHEDNQFEQMISSAELKWLPTLHPHPIDVVVFHDLSGRTHLRMGLALRCFQRLSLPHIAAQPCH